MTVLSRKFEGFIIASDKSGRNKVRFCESISRRHKLLTKQGFIIHDIVMFTEPKDKVSGLKYGVDCEYTHADSKLLVMKTLAKYDMSGLRELRLREIAGRPKRTTDMTTEQVMNILEQV